MRGFQPVASCTIVKHSPSKTTTVQPSTDPQPTIQDNFHTPLRRARNTPPQHNRFNNSIPTRQIIAETFNHLTSKLSFIHSPQNAPAQRSYVKMAHLNAADAARTIKLEQSPLSEWRKVLIKEPTGSVSSEGLPFQAINTSSNPSSQHHKPNPQNLQTRTLHIPSLTKQQKQCILQIYKNRQSLQNSELLKDRKLFFFKRYQQNAPKEKLGFLFSGNKLQENMKYNIQKGCLNKIYPCKLCGVECTSVTSLGGHLSRNH